MLLAINYYMEKIIQFFDNNLPCPSEIPDCEKRRVEYAEKLDNLKRSGGCSKCAENRLKNEFILLLQHLINTNQVR